MSAYDWAWLEVQYVTGLDSLKDMAGRDNTPALSTLELRCAQRGWVGKRRDFRAKAVQAATETALSEAVSRLHVDRGGRQETA